MEKFTFFWKGPLSQWHKSNFVVNGVGFNCAEQYMMAEKASIFSDKLTYEKIMNTSSPKEQKYFGRQVAEFDVDFWNRVAKKVVYKGNWAKFTQDNNLKSLLLATEGTTLVEASPYDKIWGIGLGKSDPRAQSRDTWQGKNWLGETLTKLRDDLILMK